MEQFEKSIAARQGAVANNINNQFSSDSLIKAKSCDKMKKSEDEEKKEKDETVDASKDDKKDDKVEKSADSEVEEQEDEDKNEKDEEKSKDKVKKSLSPEILDAYKTLGLEEDDLV